jgi:broad specificity phosphatase PhoE
MMWVLFRHGEKQMQGFDPELSPQGFIQAQKILEKVKSGKLPKPHALYVSTKKRTAQTFEPLSREFRLKSQIKAELTERVPGETSEKFRFRIQEFLVRLLLQHQDNETLYLCTHFDWIEEFMSVIESDTDLSRYSNFGAGQFILFEKKELWHMLKCEGL